MGNYRGYYAPANPSCGQRFIYDPLIRRTREADDRCYFIDRENGIDITIRAGEVTPEERIYLEGGGNTTHYYGSVHLEDLFGTGMSTMFDPNSWFMLSNWNGRWGIKFNAAGSRPSCLMIGTWPNNLTNEATRKYYANSHVFVDGRGDERYLGHWKRGYPVVGDYGIDLSNGWEFGRTDDDRREKVNSMACWISGKGTNRIIFDSVCCNSTRFAGFSVKSDACSDEQGYSQESPQFHNCFFYNNYAENIYMGYAGRASIHRAYKRHMDTGQPWPNGNYWVYELDANGEKIPDTYVNSSGTTVWPTLAPHAVVNPVIRNCVGCWSGSEQCQYQRVAGNSLMENNVWYAGAAKFETTFQAAQSRNVQPIMYSGGQGVDANGKRNEAVIRKNIFIGGGEMIMSAGEQTDALQDTRNPDGSWVTPDGPLRIHKNFFGGTRAEMVQFLLRDENNIQWFFHDNWLKGFRNDMSIVWGPGNRSRYFFVNNQNNKHRIFVGRNKIDTTDDLDYSPYVTPQGTVATAPIQLTKYSNPNHFTVYSEGGVAYPDQFHTPDAPNLAGQVKWPKFRSDFVAAHKWHQFRYYGVTKYGNGYIDYDNRTGQDNYNDGQPQFFEQGVPIMDQDLGFYKLISPSGNYHIRPSQDPANWQHVPWSQVDLDFRLDENAPENEEYLLNELGLLPGFVPSAFERHILATRKAMKIVL